MSVIAICGLPGSGKTLFATYLQLKYYKKQNSFIKRFIRKIKHEDKFFNTSFTNYPILLNKRRNQFSNIVGFYDLDSLDKFPVNIDLVFDEIQMYFDSLDYKQFPKNIRTFIQLHRHFAINNIYVLSQHPSRIVKQLRILVCEFYEVVKSIRLPLGFMFLRYNIYYNYEDFGKPVNVKKNEVVYRFKKRFKIFRYKKIYKSYDTCYMRRLQDDKMPYTIQEFIDKSMSLQEINKTFKL